MTKKPKRIAVAAVIAMAIGGAALGVALPAQASSTHPASVTQTTDTKGDGESADDTAGTAESGTEKADPVDSAGVEDGTQDGETADD